MSLKKILILGATGGLGKELKKIFNKNNFFNLILLNKKKINFNHNNCSLKLFKVLKDTNPDIVINCSGVLGDNKDEYQNIFDVNFGSNWDLVRFYNKSNYKKKIKLIFIGSSAYKTGKKNYLLYSASKSALHNLYQGSCKLFKETSIDVHIIHPKRMRTKMISKKKNLIKKNILNPNYIAKKIYRIALKH